MKSQPQGPQTRDVNSKRVLLRAVNLESHLVAVYRVAVKLSCLSLTPLRSQEVCLGGVARLFLCYQSEGAAKLDAKARPAWEASLSVWALHHRGRRWASTFKVVVPSGGVDAAVGHVLIPNTEFRIRSKNHPR